MRHILEAGNALDVATAVSDVLPENLSDTAKTIYKTLVWAAVETSRRRGESPSTTEVVLHCPLEQVARACNLHRTTLWRHLPELTALGLVAYRPHKGSLRGEVRTTGCVWRIRLTVRRGCAARLSYSDLKHRWRDLDKDVRVGRTSYRTLKNDLHHTTTSRDSEIRLEALLAWALPPYTYTAPVKPCVMQPQRADLEAVLDVTTADRNERAAAVSLAAEALAAALRDRSGLDWYRKLMWQLLRRHDASGDDHTYQVYLVAQRARTDAVEDFARRPGALFVSRLQAAKWYSEVMNSPPVRVGPRPAKA